MRGRVEVWGASDVGGWLAGSRAPWPSPGAALLEGIVSGTTTLKPPAMLFVPAAAEVSATGWGAGDQTSTKSLPHAVQVSVSYSGSAPSGTLLEPVL